MKTDKAKQKVEVKPKSERPEAETDLTAKAGSREEEANVKERQIKALREQERFHAGL